MGVKKGDETTLIHTQTSYQKLRKTCEATCLRVFNSEKFDRCLILPKFGSLWTSFSK